MKVDDLVNILESHTAEIREIIESNMPSKGDSEDLCQRLCLLNALNDLEYLVAGIKAEDLEENKD